MQPQHDHLLNIASNLTQTGQTEKAKELYKTISQAFPNDRNALKQYAYACLQNGDQEEAVTAFRTYVSQEVSDTTAQQLLKQLSEMPDGNVAITVKGLPDAKMIALAGSFNNWQPMHTFFTKADRNWICRLDLPKGRYPYKIIVDGNWQTDPGNPVTENDGSGNINSVLVVE